MSRFAAAQRPTAAKEAPFECGIVPAFEPAERFPVRFYLVAMIFIIFDIEVVFLYPWAVIFHQLGRFGLVEMLVFALAVVVAFAYLVSNGALEWGPAKRLRRVESPLVRTTASTVRKVSSSERAA
jgi:NADH-quinone oxidoreductase subunit A